MRDKKRKKGTGDRKVTNKTNRKESQYEKENMFHSSDSTSTAKLIELIINQRMLCDNLVRVKCRVEWASVARLFHSAQNKHRSFDAL